MSDKGLYTHCVRLGLIKGQRWIPKIPGKGLGGIVAGITEKGWVILDHDPKLCGDSKIPIDDLLNRFKLLSPVELKPYTHRSGKTFIQIIIKDRQGKSRVYGQIGKEYFHRRETVFEALDSCKCNCHIYGTNILHIFPCCSRCYEKYREPTEEERKLYRLIFEEQK